MEIKVGFLIFLGTGIVFQGFEECCYKFCTVGVDDRRIIGRPTQCAIVGIGFCVFVESERIGTFIILYRCRTKLFRKFFGLSSRTVFKRFTA